MDSVRDFLFMKALPIIGIYKITSPTGKIYIGQSRNVKKRFSGYSRMNKNNARVVRLFRSLEKHTPYKHNFTVIEECDILKLNERERYWQDHYDVCGKNGLNCVLTKSRDKPTFISEETREKMSASGKNKVITAEHLEKIRMSAKLRIGTKGKKQNKEQKEATRIRNIKSGSFKGSKNPMYGSNRFADTNPFYNKKHSSESRLKMSNYAKIRIITEKTRNQLSIRSALGRNNASKLVLNLETGIYYDCGKEAWMSTSKFKYSTFKSKLNGSNKHPLSFIYA